MNPCFFTLKGKRRPHTMEAEQMIANARSAREQQRAALAAGDARAARSARMDVRDWAMRFRAAMERVEWRDAEPAAWMRTEGKRAMICAWCPSKAAADAAAVAAGYVPSHGICQRCAVDNGFTLRVDVEQKKFTPAHRETGASKGRENFDAGKARSFCVPRRCAPRLSLGRPTAAASTPPAPAARIDSISKEAL